MIPKNLLTTLLIAALFLLTFTETSASQNKNITCGVITAQTGPMGILGTGLQKAITLAHKKSKNTQINFIFEDDQFIPKNTVSAVRKLISHHRVNCLITFGSTTSLAVADIAEKAKTPLISIAITPHIAANRSYVFRAHIPIEQQSEAIEKVITKKDYRTIGIITTIQDATMALREELISSISPKVIFDQQVNPTERDFKVFAAKLVTANPDAIFLNLLPPQGGISAKQLRTLGYKGDFFSGPPIGNPSELISAEGTLEGSWFASFNNANTKEFFDSYKSEFKESAPMEAVYGYEIVNIIIKANEDDNLISGLKSLNHFKGMLGDYGINNNNIEFPASIWSVKNNEFFFSASYPDR